MVGIMTLIEWKTRADAVSDAELAEFRRRICVVTGHVGLCVPGLCSRCDGGTASISMEICEGCASEMGVCPYDQRMTGWGSVSAQDGEAIAARWLALLRRGYKAEREAAKRALLGFPLAGLATDFEQLERQPGTLTCSPAQAEFTVGFHGRVPNDLTEGAMFLNGTVVRVFNPAHGLVIVQTTDAARFEDLAAKDPQVRYIELSGNSPTGK